MSPPVTVADLKQRLPHALPQGHPWNPPDHDLVQATCDSMDKVHAFWKSQKSAKDEKSRFLVASSKAEQGREEEADGKDRLAPDTRMALQFVVGSAMTVASLTEASSDKAQAAIIRSVLPEVHPTDRDDQMLVSDAYWIAFASDVMHAKSDEFATKSCQVWDKMQEGHIVTLAHRIVAAVVWRATNLDSIDKELVSVKRHLEGIGVADCLYQSFRTECYRMVSMKLCASDGAGADDNQLGYLDNLISRSIVDPEDLSSLRKELRRGITMLVSESDPRSSFLAVQVWRQWISKTHHSQRDLMEVKKIARYLEEKCCESQDPLALIGMFECRITLACLSVDDEEFTSTLSNFRELPDVFFRLTHLPPKAVYEAAFLAYWARASGACQDAAFKLKVTALLKSFKATCAPCNNLHAYPFISLRYGLNYHFYRLSVDLQSAIGASSLQDTTDVNNLMHWLSDHTADVFPEAPECPPVKLSLSSPVPLGSLNPL